ncbi:hypothetical protein [Hydrogenophaga sp. T2]|uniref:hypothetical protein n=1 Tax=Hydrogenophaga sp. T2 TaxID=3132823 RepID=UPI003CF159DF
MKRSSSLHGLPPSQAQARAPSGPMWQPPPAPLQPPWLADLGNHLRRRNQLTHAMFGPRLTPPALERLITEAEAFNDAIRRLQAHHDDPGVCLPIAPAQIERARFVCDPRARPEADAAPVHERAGGAPRIAMPDDVALLMQRFDALDLWGPLSDAPPRWIGEGLACLARWVHEGADPATAWALLLVDRLQAAFTALLLSGHQTLAGLERLRPALNAFAALCEQAQQQRPDASALEPPGRELVGRAWAIARATAAAQRHEPDPRSALDHDTQALARALAQRDNRLVLQYRNRVQHGLHLQGLAPTEEQQTLIAQAQARVGLVPQTAPRSRATFDSH